MDRDEGHRTYGPCAGCRFGTRDEDMGQAFDPASDPVERQIVEEDADAVYESGEKGVAADVS